MLYLSNLSFFVFAQSDLSCPSQKNNHHKIDDVSGSLQNFIGSILDPLPKITIIFYIRIKIKNTVSYILYDDDTPTFTLKIYNILYQKKHK